MSALQILFIALLVDRIIDKRLVPWTAYRALLMVQLLEDVGTDYVNEQQHGEVDDEDELGDVVEKENR